MKTKRCSKCEKDKLFVEFYKDRNKKTGLSSCCKSCSSAYSIKKAKTIDGLIKRIYYNQKNASRRRNMHQPTYSKSELKTWMLSQCNFNALYNKWVKSGYKKNLVPSVDRLDDYKGYSFDNIRLTDWASNKAKLGFNRINGLNNKCSLPVVCMSEKEDFVAEYFSQSNAEIHTGINQGNISEACSGLRKRAGGFKWMYAEDYYAK